MLTLRRASDRGHANHGWLDSHHTFSFADYHDPRHMGFRGLRVINEDRVQPGRGFGTHGHRDMEIISYVLDGALQHRDSMGNGSVIRPGDVQRMTAGTGVTHSEHNASDREVVHFLQIWLLPERRGLPPGYEQKTFPRREQDGGLRLLAAPHGGGGDGCVTLHCDARLYVGELAHGATAELALAPGRHAWVQVVRGKLNVQGQELAAGDGAALSEESTLRLEGGPAQAGEWSEALVFELP